MRPRTYIWLLLASFIGFSGCFHKPDDTIIFLGPESYVKSINDIVQNEVWVNDFMGHMEGIVEGFYPPDIEGEFKISEKQFVTSNFADLSDHLDMYLKVDKQHNRIATVDLYEGESVYTDTAYIMGDHGRFTLYFKEKRELEYNGVVNSHHRLVVITGSRVEEGISNLYFGSLILSPGDNADTLMGSFTPGWYFIYRDRDGLSEEGDWFSNEEEEEDVHE